MNQPSIKTKPSDGSAPRDWRYHSTAENLILGRKSNPGQPQGLHYDDAYRLIGTTQGLALGTTLGEDEFVSDGTVGTPNPGNWRSSYAYDAADNLTQASSETNPAGNWMATPNSLNQITSKGGNSWVYDAAGNLLDDGVRSYEWDAQQRLIALTDKATGRKSEFIYDGQSRLTVTKEYPAGSATASETRYLWCGHKVCQSRDGQDNVTARYFDEGEIKTSNTGSTALYYTRDHLGSIMETTQASGKVLGSLDYGPYGEPEKAQGQLPDFRYAGMLHHAPTGLYLTHYRAYDPTVGRWLNRDPIEESGGINLYGYVGGNPVSRIDPLGLWSTEAHNYFIDKHFSSLPSVIRDIVKEGSLNADKPKYQTGAYAYMHAMSSDALTPAEAQQKMCKFIKEQFAFANEAKNVGSGAYWYHVGMALHAVMDSTSPAHEGFQKWHGVAKDGHKHGPWPSSLENLKVAQSPVHTQKTLQKMQEAMQGNYGGCGC